MFMIMFVLDNPDLLDKILDSWEEVDIHNATIVDSTGIQRLRRKNIPYRYLFPSPGAVEEGHLTLFVIVENEEMVQTCLQAIELVVGDLDKPDTGVFTAWPLTTVRGVPHCGQGE